jgi:hypothetical protein
MAGMTPRYRRRPYSSLAEGGDAPRYCTRRIVFAWLQWPLELVEVALGGVNTWTMTRRSRAGPSATRACPPADRPDAVVAQRPEDAVGDRVDLALEPPEQMTK